MVYNNYSVSTGKGKLYLKAKTPTEGYEEITYGTENKKTYHKYVNSIQGMPTIVETKEVQFDGKTLRFLEITLVEGDVSNKVSMPLKNMKGNYTDEVKALISSLNGLILGEVITLSPKASTSVGKNNKEYKNFNIYLNYVNILNDEGKGKSTGFIPFTEIPKPVEKIVAGDKTWDWAPQTEYYYSKLLSIQENFKNAPAPPVAGYAGPTTSAVTPATTLVTPQVANASDELPF